MSLTELLGHVGLFGGAVMVCLALLSFISVGVILDKQRRFRSASNASPNAAPTVQSARMAACHAAWADAHVPMGTPLVAA